MTVYLLALFGLSLVFATVRNLNTYRLMKAVDPNADMWIGAAIKNGWIEDAVYTNKKRLIIGLACLGAAAVMYWTHGASVTHESLYQSLFFGVVMTVLGFIHLLAEDWVCAFGPAFRISGILAMAISALALLGYLPIS